MSESILVKCKDEKPRRIFLNEQGDVRFSELQQLFSGATHLELELSDVIETYFSVGNIIRKPYGGWQRNLTYTVVVPCILQVLSAPPPAPPSAYVPMFCESLRKGGIHRPNDDIIKIILGKYETNLMAAAADTAGSLNLYECVSKLPQASTRNLLRESLGIKIGENLNPSYPNRIFKGLDGKKPVILKLAKEGEINTYVTIFRDKPKEEMAAVYLVHCKPISIQNDDALRAVKQHSEYMPSNCKRFEALQMDWYIFTLNDSMPVGLDDLYTGALQIEKALNYIHSTGHVHMDVKGDNIFVDYNGQWYLGDFDSCVAEGEAIRSTTDDYYPIRMLGLRAQFKYDWYMLVVALAFEVVKHDAEDALHEKLWNKEFRIDNDKLKAVIEGIALIKLREFMSHYQAIGYS